jgi:hypothetical protein
MTAPSSLTVSVYQAALLWFGKDPHERLKQYGEHDWIILLTRDRDVRDIACAILFEIECGHLPVVRTSWLSGLPASWAPTLGSLPGNRDPRGTTVTLGNLKSFATRRGDNPGFLDDVFPEPAPGPLTHSGGAGRPSGMHLIADELRRRAKANELENTRAAEAAELLNWFSRTHPTLRRPTRKTIANYLSRDGLYRDLKSGGPK